MKKFCKICYQKMIEKKIIDEKIPIDNIVFRCNKEIYTINGYGDLVKLVWDCEKQEYKEVREK